MERVKARSFVLVVSFMCSDEINAWEGGQEGELDYHFYVSGSDGLSANLLQVIKVRF